jgi:hypothetical protein
MSNVKGIEALIAKIQNMGTLVAQEVKEQVEYHTGEIELEAIRNAPGGGDRIRTEFGSQSQERVARGRNWIPISQAIGYEITNNGYAGTVFVERGAGEIAAYIEFGTGQSASSYLSTVDPEWRAEAQRFYVNGKGTIINQPYLYPAYLKHRSLFIKDLKQALKNIK